MISEENELYIDTIKVAFDITNCNCIEMQKHIEDLSISARKKISANQLSKMCGVNCQTIINIKNRINNDIDNKTKTLSELMLVKLFKAFHEIALNDIKNYNNYKLCNMLIGYFYYDGELNDSGWSGMSLPYYDSSKNELLSQIQNFKDIDTKCVLTDKSIYESTISEKPYELLSSEELITFVNNYITNLDQFLVCNTSNICDGLSRNLKNLRIISGIPKQKFLETFDMGLNNYRHYEDITSQKQWIKLNDAKSIKLLYLLLDDENYSDTHRLNRIEAYLKKITSKDYKNKADLIDKEIAFEVAKTYYYLYEKAYDRRFDLEHVVRAKEIALSNREHLVKPTFRTKERAVNLGQNTVDADFTSGAIVGLGALAGGITAALISTFFLKKRSKDSTRIEEYKKEIDSIKKEIKTLSKEDREELINLIKECD